MNLDIPEIPEGEPEEKDLLLDSLPPILRRYAQWMHYWVKTGVLSSDVVEHHLNGYLLVPILLRMYSKPFSTHFSYTVMFKTDSPCFENLPDLWFVMRDTLKNVLFPKKKQSSIGTPGGGGGAGGCGRTGGGNASNPKSMLHSLFMQALPCFHQTTKSVKVDEYMGVVCNVLLALLLGLYQEANKKPHFVVRVKLFEKVHELMTSNSEIQQRFLVKHNSVVVLAFMEYIARVAFKFWPVEYEFLRHENNMAAFFEKIPLLCDEFRVLDLEWTWDKLEESASTNIHKCARSRRVHRGEDVTYVAKKKSSNVNVDKICDMPIIPYGKADEYALLGHAMRVDGKMLMEGHKSLQVFRLPKNIEKMQLEKLSEKYPCKRLLYVSSRMFVCLKCVLNKKTLHKKFRLDTQTQSMICSECLGSYVVSLDVLGRTVVIHGIVYILCPCCCEVHPYEGDLGSWLSQCWVLAQGKQFKRRDKHERIGDSGMERGSVGTEVSHEKRPKIQCHVCQELYSHGNVYERINHLTGVLECVAFCFKHNPLELGLRECVNVTLLQNVATRKSRITSLS